MGVVDAIVRGLRLMLSYCLTVALLSHPAAAPVLGRAGAGYLRMPTRLEAPWTAHEAALNAKLRGIV